MMTWSIAITGGMGGLLIWYQTDILPTAWCNLYSDFTLRQALRDWSRACALRIETSSIFMIFIYSLCCSRMIQHPPKMQPRAPWSNCLSASPLSESSDDLTPSDSMAKSSQVSLVSLVMVMMVVMAMVITNLNLVPNWSCYISSFI